jgi:hypothetical protein
MLPTYGVIGMSRKLLPVLASMDIFDSESRSTHEHILLSHNSGMCNSELYGVTYHQRCFMQTISKGSKPKSELLGNGVSGQWSGRAGSHTFQICGCNGFDFQLEELFTC